MTINVENISLENGEFARVLRWSENVDIVEIVNANGKCVPLKGSGSLWHLHEEIELTLVTSGSGIRLVGDQVGQISAPCLVLIGTNLPHYWHFSGPSSGLSVQFCIPRLDALLPPHAKADLVRFTERAAKGLQFTGRTMENFASAVEVIGSDKGMSRMGRLLRLVGEIANSRSPLTRKLSTKRFDVSRLAPGYEGIQSAIVFMMARFSEELELVDVLAVSHMSKASFSRRFVTYTGKTFTEFLNDVRIDYACQKLLTTDENIGEVAFMSGYQNLAHFNRMFRRYRGCSPSEYRRGD